MNLAVNFFLRRVTGQFPAGNRKGGRPEIRRIVRGLLGGMFLFFLAAIPNQAADGVDAAPGVVHR